MANTPNNNLPLLTAAQSQKHVTVNDALYTMDVLVQPSVINATTVSPPGSPIEGDTYIVASGATGDWSTHVNHVAAYMAGSWRYYVPSDGWMFYNDDVSAHVVWDGTAWVGISATIATPTMVQVSITHPTSPDGEVSVTGTGDADLNPATYSASFVDVLNEYTQVFLNGTKLAVDADGRVRAVVDCIVQITGYMDTSHSSNNATVGVVFSIESGGSTTLSPRAVRAKMPSSGDVGNLSGNGALSLSAGDIVGVAVASDITGTISITSSSLNFIAY